MTAPPGPTGPRAYSNRTRRRLSVDALAPRPPRSRGTPYRALVGLGTLVIGLALVLVAPAGAVSDLAAAHAALGGGTIAAVAPFEDGGNNSSGSDDGSGSGSYGGGNSSGNGTGASNGTAGNTSSGSSETTNTSQAANASSSDPPTSPSAGANESAPVAGSGAGAGGSSSISLGTVGVPAVLAVLGLIGAVVIFTDLRARRRRPPKPSTGA